MDLKKKIIIVVTGIVVIVAMIFPFVRRGMRMEPEEVVELPPYVEIESEDTYKGSFEIEGLWQEAMSDFNILSFQNDGTYLAAGRFSDGEYTVDYDVGYVALTDSTGATEILRVLTEDGEIRLQRDMRGIPYTYIKSTMDSAESAEFIEYVRSRTWRANIVEEVERLGTDAIYDILTRCRWKTVDDEEIGEVFFSQLEGVFYTHGQKEIKRGLYDVSEVVLKDEGYYAVLTIGDARYSLEITPKWYYNEERYNLLLVAEDGREIRAQSTGSAQIGTQVDKISAVNF